MKKLLLSFLICSSLLNFAQDWNPFPLGQKSYFMHDNIQGFYSTDTLMNEFCVDSLRDYGSSQTMYFNFTTPNIGNCYSTIISSNFNFLYYFHDNERPDSITVSNSEYTFYFYDYYLTFQNTFVFKPLIQKDSSWIFTYNGNGFNQLKITCDSIFYDTFFGTISDSIKIFSVQALNSGTPVSDVINQDKYILSKNYGFKSFKNFPLLGIKTNTQQEGFSPPVFEDYYHLNIGDVLIWKEQFDTQDFINYPSYTKYFKDSIVGIFNTIDTISYGIIRTKQDLTTYNTGSTRYKVIDDVVFSVGTSTLAPKIFMTQAFGDIDLDEVTPYYINNGVIHKGKINELKYLQTNSNGCTPNYMWDYGWWESYNTKYGVYQYGHFGMDGYTNWYIIGSTINGIQEGVLWSTLVTGINENEKIGNVIIYPNPSKSGNFILESEQVNFIELFTIDGKTVFTKTINQPKTEIKTSLPNGLYFVKLTFENKKQATQKLIITD